MNNNQSIDMLTYILIFMIFVLIILTFIFVILKAKERENKKIKKQEIAKVPKKSKNEDKIKEYSKESIFSFMDFDKIEDNMIIKKEKKNYLMVIECQGINYDLMSGIEKSSVEQGFLQFLNTLRHPIQIYIQTRTVNLGSSIKTYREKLKQIQDKLVKAELEYRQKENSKKYSPEELAKLKLEVVKQKNLYDYGKDIIKNTEQMSLNKNILTKQYYIIISYYAEEIDNKDYDEEEIKNLAFSELYTKAQSIMSALYVCGINGKILDSTQLVELLYIAYNRDEAETYELNKMLNSGFQELYSTAPDVLDKKIKELDKKIEEEAIKKANRAAFVATEENEKEKAVREKERKLDQLIDDMAKIIIDENENFLGSSVTERAKEIIDRESNEKGGNENEEKAKKTGRTRKAV